jgi:hypothetical protein
MPRTQVRGAPECQERPHTTPRSDAFPWPGGIAGFDLGGPDVVGIGLSRARSGAGDLFLFGQTEETEVAQWVVKVVILRIPARFRLDPLRDLIVLSPMRQGEAGVGALNE